MFLPHKKSKFWFLVILLFFFLNLGSLLLSRYLLGSLNNLTLENIIGYTIVSIINTSLIGLGYFGFNVFAGTLMGFNVIGIIYLMAASILNNADGWTDLTSFFGYETLVISGVVLGIIAQLTKLVIRKINKK